MFFSFLGYRARCASCGVVVMCSWLCVNMHPAFAIAQYGALVLRSSPSGVQVYVDGQMVCQTPCTLPHLAPGERVLSFVKLGFATKDRMVSVVAGKTHKVSIRLRKEQRQLLLQSEPSGAEVMHGAKFLGRTPLWLPAAASRYRLRLSKNGYRTLYQTIAVKAGEKQSIRLYLKPWHGYLEVSTSPPHAEVWVDGKKLGLSKHTVLLRAGRHSVRIRREGFGAVERHLLLLPTQRQRIHVRLPPARCSSRSPALVNGKKQGPEWRCGYQHRWVLFRFWRDGVLHGDSLHWHATDCTINVARSNRWYWVCAKLRKKSEGVYLNGKRRGIWSFWSETGVHTRRNYR